MPLYIVNEGNPNIIGQYILKLVGYDDNFIINYNCPYQDLTQVEYLGGLTLNQSDPLYTIKSVLAYLMGFVSPQPVYVMGARCTDLDPVDNTPLSAHAGVTLEAGQIGGAGNGLIIYQDTTDCCGAGYYVFDTNGNKTPEPGPVILFHELAHAYLILNGMAYNDPNQEPMAEQYENYVRTTIYSLPPRDESRHGGGCNPTPPPTPTPSSDCIIASTAYGSPRAAEVENLRSVRNNLLQSSILGDEFFTTLYKEYYQFSPTVAEKMRESSLVKNVISLFLVQPFLDFLDLLDFYLRDISDPLEMGVMLKSSISDWISKINETTLQHEWNVLYGILSNLQDKDLAKNTFYVESSSLPDKFDEFSISIYLKFMILEYSNKREHLKWALLEPLGIYYYLANQTRSGTSENLVKNFLDRINSWLNHAPIPPSFMGFDEKQARRELDILSKMVFIRKEPRYAFGSRLLSSCSLLVSYDLNSLLEELGYIPKSEEVAD